MNGESIILSVPVCGMYDGEIDRLRRIGTRWSRTQRSQDWIEPLPLTIQSVVAKETERASTKEVETLTRYGKTLYGVSIAKNGDEQKLLTSETGEIVRRESRRPRLEMMKQRLPSSLLRSPVFKSPT